MLHNKYFEILKRFLGDYTGEVYGRMLIGKVSLSPKGIALALAELQQQGILKSRSQGLIKYYKLNFDNSEIKDIVIVAEIMRKVEFLSIHRKLAHLLRKDERVVGVFGSYAKGTQKEGSDVDLFIVGKRQKHDYNENGRLFDLNVSTKYFTKAEWGALLRAKNSMVKEIVGNHVTIFEVERFVNSLWRDYYGFD